MQMLMSQLIIQHQYEPATTDDSHQQRPQTEKQESCGNLELEKSVAFGVVSVVQNRASDAPR